MEQILVLKDEIKETERILSLLDKKIADLKSKPKSDNNSLLLKETNKLYKEHSINLVDISDYKNQIKEIENILVSQIYILDELRIENDKLKANKIKIRSESPINKIKGIKDLANSFGLKLINKRKEQKEQEIKIKEDKKKEEEKKEEFEKLKKLKKEKEILFKELQKEINSYFKEAESDKIYTINYRNYIESLKDQISSYRQQLRISIVGGENVNYAQSIESYVNALSNDMDKTIYIINEINYLLDIIKVRIINEAENTLKDINNAFSEINDNKTLNFGFLLNKMDITLIKIEDLKKICELLKKDLSDISSKRNNIEEKIKDIKINFEKLMNKYKEIKKKMNDDLIESIRKRGKNIISSIDKSLREERYDKVDEENEEICDAMAEGNYDDKDDDNLLLGTSLINIRDFGKNIDMLKTGKLFYNRNEDKENNSNTAKIIRKNWNEVCYIYDDYDIHDVNFEIKAVGLSPSRFFNSCGVEFNSGIDIEILDFEIDGKRSKYTYENNSFEYSINLKNLEKAKIHVKYRERPNFNKMNENEKAVYLYYRKLDYGLSKKLEGQMGKFRLILKGNFEIVSFEDDFFIRNIKNKREKEYIWGGKVPPGGKKTSTQLSKKEANWNVSYCVDIISSSGNIRKATLKVPTGFLGGNNNIIKIGKESPQTNDIQIIQEKRIYEIKYENTQYKEGNFKIIGQIKNKCKGEWKVDLSDELIERQIPREDKRDKKKLAEIAGNIIDEYNRNNKKNILEVMDFYKIAKWVYKNIKYDINYSGRTEMTAMDIYNKRIGVCHHKTRLANALLYSLGYKVIYASGYTCSEKPRYEKDSGHCWSLINVKGIWYPFDATWNILSGKLPVCHIFFNFFDETLTWSSYEQMKVSSKCVIEYIN